MGPDVLICRPLGLADCADAMALYGDLAGPGHLSALAQPQFAALLAHPGTSVWGAERAGRVVAMATLHLLPETCLRFTG